MTTTSPLGRTVRGTGPGLLLAHGATGSIDANYGPLLDGLAAHHRVVGPDYPGSGRTPRATGPLDLDGLADALVATAVEEGLDTFAVAGYSLGTPLAVRAATRHPSRVTALVLTAAFAHPSARMRLLLDDWLRLLRADDGHEAVARWTTLIAAGAPYLDRMPADELTATIAATRDSIPPGAIDQVLLCTRADVRADLSRLAVPTLVISTTHDAMVTPHHHHEVAAGIPDAQLAELPTGHLPFVEAPAEWLTLIRDFLAATA
ncbi:alpha/beta fold hydrolase [Streptomyces sp. BRA346]|uniref:alpha/beta fold hydrolase n=1 Tax=Streptomyces sp. BRA346 TaxID=2878199 RepID=UPI00406333E8